MKLRDKVCIVVDAYSTGNKLAGIFDAYGYSSLHVQSQTYIPDVLKKFFKKEDFIDQFIFENDLERLVSRIKSKGYQVKCVVAGAESGVVLADHLAEKLQVPGNATSHSVARRDKFLMAEALKTSSIRHIRYFKSSDLRKIINWIRENQLKTVVLKPIASSGTFGFHICHCEDDVKKAFDNLYNKQDIFGNFNHEILVQEYISGQEYCINMVSYQGSNFVSEMWKVDKTELEHSKIYDLETLVAENCEEFLKVKTYVESVLKALKIDYGASHSEVIIDCQTGDPVLVEVAARFMGSLDVSLILEAYGTNAVLLTAEACIQPEVFLSRIKHRSLRALRKYPAMVQLVSRHEGQLKHYNLDLIRELKTFHGLDIYIEPGKKIKKTVDSYSSLGRVYLLGDNESEILVDYQKIREMEQRGTLCHVERI